MASYSYVRVVYREKKKRGKKRWVRRWGGDGEREEKREEEGSKGVRRSEKEKVSDFSM